MSRAWTMLAGALLCGHLAAACAPGPVCGPSEGPGLDGASHADAGGVRDAPEPRDEGPRDGGPLGCAPGRETRLFISPLSFAVGLGDVRSGDAFGEPFRVRLYRVSDGVLFYDAVGSAALAGNIGLANAGTYDVVVESAGYASGAAIPRPSDCAADGPHCRPLRVTLGACEQRLVPVALYCDPGLGACPPVAWPWE